MFRRRQWHPTPVLLPGKSHGWRSLVGCSSWGRKESDIAAAKSLQSCPTLCDPRQQPTRLPRPWDSPGKNTGVGRHFLLQCMKVKRLQYKIKSLRNVEYYIFFLKHCFRSILLTLICYIFILFKIFTRFHFGFSFDTWII